MPIINLIYNAPQGWKPWANTIAYYKFDWNLNDSSGNNRNLSMSTWTFTYWTESWGGKYVYMDRNSWSNYWEDSINYNNTTLAFWRKGTSSSPTSWATAFIEIWSASDQSYIRCQQNIQFAYRPNLTYSAGTSWHHYVLVSQTSTCDLYVDWVKVNSWTAARTWTKTTRFRLNQVADTNSSTYSNDWYLWELIRESKEWTADEILAYYNNIKSNYWL